jgi:hypothetical protein
MKSRVLRYLLALFVSFWVFAYSVTLWNRTYPKYSSDPVPLGRDTFSFFWQFLQLLWYSIATTISSGNVQDRDFTLAWLQLEIPFILLFVVIVLLVYWLLTALLPMMLGKKHR